MNTAYGNLVWYYHAKRLAEFCEDDNDWQAVLLISKTINYFDFITCDDKIISIGETENAIDTLSDEQVMELPDEDPALNWRLPINEAAGFDITGFIKSLMIAWPGKYRAFNYNDNMEQGIIIAFCLNDPIRNREGLRRAIAHRLNVWATNL